MNLRFSLLALCVLAFTAQAQLQTSDPYPERVGIATDFNLNMHSADFGKLPGVPSCCPSFEEGDGTGFSFAILYENQLSTMLGAGLRLAYATQSAMLETIETQVISNDGDPEERGIEHTLDAKISTIGIEPVAYIYPARRFKINLGLRIGYILQAEYEQYERLPEAYPGTFTDTGTRERNHTSGDIPEAQSIEVAALAGLIYEVPIGDGGDWSLAPEVFYYYGLTDVVESITWTMNSVRFGLALKKRL